MALEPSPSGGLVRWLARPEHLSRAMAGCVLLLALLVMSGWLLRVPVLVQAAPGAVGMVFNTALVFAVYAAALLLPAHVPWRRSLQIAAAVIGMTLPALVLAEYALNRDLGVDRLLCEAWLADSNPNPGRMAPSTCVAFELAGVLLLLINKRATRGLLLALRVCLGTLCALAVLGATGYGLRLELVHGWLQVVRMAPSTAAMLLLLAGSLRQACHALPSLRELMASRDDRGVGITSAVILGVVALTAGVAGFSSMQYASEQSTRRALSLALEYRVRNVETELARELQRTRLLASRAPLRAAIRAGSPLALSDELNRMYDASYSYLALVDDSGRVLTALGREEPASLEVPLELGVPATLRWQQGLTLKLEVPVADDDEVLARLRAVIPLPGITELLAHPRAVGKSALFDLCTPRKTSTVCFPNASETRPTTRPLWKQSQLVPIGHALAGESGVLSNVVDTRGRLVVAAYRPLPKSQLGVVLKLDAQELYAPIAHRLKHMVPLLLLLVAGGVLLLRANVSPLIRQMVSSEQRALSAIRELMRGERQTRAIVDGVSDAIITIDQSGVILSFNPAAVRTFGYEAPEVIGRTLEVLLTPESYRQHSADLLRCASDGERSGPSVGSVELEARSKQGTAIDVEVTVNEIRAGEGRFFVAVLRDVSERRRTERLKSEFVATVSHELRTPLTSIRGSLGLIAGGVFGQVPAEVQRLVGIAHDNSERLVRLINDILDIEKIEAGRMQFRFDAVELKNLVGRAIDATLGYAEEFGVSFELESEFVSAGVVVDADRIHQVLLNLLSNAVKYSPRGGKVRVELRARQELVRISVSDDGPGIPEAFYARIFGKFSQADASDTRAKGGTGLGLSIAKAIVERHGGEIGFESEVGRGSTFYVDLPGCPWPKARPRLTASSSSFRRVLFSAPRILHVEDDDQSREIVATMLEPIARVVGASSLAAARKALASDRFDLVLLDLKLQDGAGQTLLEELDSAPGSRVAVVVFTAHEGELDADVFNRVDQVLVKARISEEHFQSTILELLRERSERHSAVS